MDKVVQMLIGFANNGKSDFHIENIQASLRYPQDFTYYIYNVSVETSPQSGVTGVLRRALGPAGIRKNNRAHKFVRTFTLISSSFTSPITLSVVIFPLWSQMKQGPLSLRSLP